MPPSWMKTTEDWDEVKEIRENTIFVNSGYMATLTPLPCGIALELFSIPTENI